MIRSSSRSFPLAACLLFLAAAASAFQVKVEPQEPQPGDMIRVEIIGLDNPARAKCRFGEKTYPFYTISPGRMRALIGVSARVEPRWYALKITRSRFLLPDETKTIGVTVQKRAFTHQYLTMPEKKTRLSKMPEARTAITTIRDTLEKDTAPQHWQGPFIRPAAGRQTSAYGHTRTINRKMSWDWHKGIDIAAPAGLPIVSPNGGTVVLTGRFPVQGGTIIVDHGQGVMSAFLHIKSFNLKEGDTVAKGGILATVGGSGFSTGSHLHWGVYVHGVPVDPETILGRKF